MERFRIVLGQRQNGKAVLFEEQDGVFWFLQEFSLAKLGTMEKTAEVEFDGKVYDLYFVCKTTDGRRFFIGVEKEKSLSAVCEYEDTVPTA